MYRSVYRLKFKEYLHRLHYATNILPTLSAFECFPLFILNLILLFINVPCPQSFSNTFTEFFSLPRFHLTRGCHSKASLDTLVPRIFLHTVSISCRLFYVSEDCFVCSHQLYDISITYMISFRYSTWSTQ